MSKPLLNTALVMAILVGSPAWSQIPAKCFEIESILVDACISAVDCPGSQEGQNEMVRFRTGPVPLALADIVVDWPNNNWLGFVQNALTAQLTADLNATVQGCGFLLEPPGGIIPPGSVVLMVTSTEMCVAANSFAALSDTIHLVFQAPGNTTGHFANHNNGIDTLPTPTGPASLRTLIMTHLPSNCGDTATYDRSLLVNVFGNYGGLSSVNDGATVRFDWPGLPAPTYINLGCLAPYEPLLVSIDPPATGICDGISVDLNGTVIGDVLQVVWSGGDGTFSDPDAIATTYTPGPNDVGQVELTFCAIGLCGAPICTTIQLPVGTTPNVTITPDGPTTLCPNTLVTLTATGADAYLWSTGDTTDAVVVNVAGLVSVTGFSACGQQTVSITISEGTLPVVTIDPPGPVLICAGQNVTLTASGADSYSWDNGQQTATITVDQPGVFNVTGTNACGQDTAQVLVQQVALQAAFTAVPLSGPAPLDVTFTNTSTPGGASSSWSFGDGGSGNQTSPVYTYQDPGSWEVLLTVSQDGCTSTATATITVTTRAAEESSLYIPNVFSPNGDGVNDIFLPRSQGLSRYEVRIYNRYGELVCQLRRTGEWWDGRTFAGEPVTEGTYFYVAEAVGEDEVDHSQRGTLTLVR